MRRRFDGLWRHPEFLKLWAGETVSLFGSQITQLALPLTAVVVLKATPAQMGLLGAAQFLPFLVVGLFAGVWVDRTRRRPILIATDVGRVLSLGSIPLAAGAGVLGFGQLYAVALVTGVLTVFFDVSYQSFLPSLVQREHLIEGNSKLEVSRSAAQVGGPSVAGLLVQIASAPFAIAIDAASFLFSAAFISAIRSPEAPPAATARRSIWSEIGDGLRLVGENPLLRAIAGSTATSNLFSSLSTSVVLLFIVRVLGLQPGLLGAIFAVGGIGSVAGALLAGRIARTAGLGRTLTLAMLVIGAVGFVVPALHGVHWYTAPLIAFAMAVGGFVSPVYNVNQVSLRQTITPDRLLGRVNATMRFIVWGTIPLGSLLGGVLGDRIGLRSTLLIGAAGGSLAFLWLVLSPVRGLRAAPLPTTAVL